MAFMKRLLIILALSVLIISSLPGNVRGEERKVVAIRFHAKSMVDGEFNITLGVGGQYAAERLILPKDSVVESEASFNTSIPCRWRVEAGFNGSDAAILEGVLESQGARYIHAFLDSSVLRVDDEKPVIALMVYGSKACLSIEAETELRGLVAELSLDVDCDGVYETTESVEGERSGSVVRMESGFFLATKPNILFEARIHDQNTSVAVLDGSIDFTEGVLSATANADWSKLRTVDVGVNYLTGVWKIALPNTIFRLEVAEKTSETLERASITFVKGLVITKPLRLVIKVVGSYSIPIEGAAVTVVNSDNVTLYETETNSSGVAVFLLPTGEYEVEISKEDYRTEKVTVGIADKDVYREVMLEKIRFTWIERVVEIAGENLLWIALGFIVLLLLMILRRV